MGIEHLAENLWIASQPFNMMGVNLGTRMTIVRLTSGHLLVYSPIKLNDELKTSITELGQVKYVIAPNEFHYLYAQQFVDAFPQSQFYCVHGLLKKKTDLPDPHIFQRENTYPWDEELSSILLEGGKLFTEYLLFHPSSRTLISTDIMFNFKEAEKFGHRLLLTINGCYKKASPSRLLKFVLKDKAEAKRVISQVINEWDFDRMILAHGEVIEKGAKEALKKGFAYLL